MDYFVLFLMAISTGFNGLAEDGQAVAIAATNAAFLFFMIGRMK